MNESLFQRLLRKRIYLLVVAHLAIFAFTYAVAFALRFEWSVPSDMKRLFWQTIGFVILLKLTFFLVLGNLHGWWRYVTFSDLASLLKVTTLSTLAITGIDYFLLPQLQIPRVVLVIDFGATVLFAGGLRSIWRLLDEHVMPSIQTAKGQRPVLLIGAGREGSALARQIHTQSVLRYRVVGFLDENKSHWGSFLGGIPILGSLDAAITLCKERDIHDILMLTNSVSTERLRTFIGPCKEAGIQFKIIPPVDDLVTNNYRIHVRDIDINDLLGRPAVQLDNAAIAEMIAGRRVMVSGAGGSIGSEICRQILRGQPESLLMVERAENNLFNIDRELASRRTSTRILPLIADIRDDERMRSLFEQHRPQLVFHCAAHKHVPMMECNAGEAIKNNVLGTMAMVDLAEEFDVERFVMISTDKAVNPTSIMGVSKQLAERYVHANSETSSSKLVVVRFGNVLASAGSVVPIFQEQIRRGGPITITHPDMCRYFMSIPEASQLVLQAATMGKGGEIFVLNMGKPVKIHDLARDLIRLSGFGPDEIEITFTGIRPGEKLFEELYFDEEETIETTHPDVRVAYHRPDDRNDVMAAIGELQLAMHDSPETIRAILSKISPDYRPTIIAPTGRATAQEIT